VPGQGWLSRSMGCAVTSAMSRSGIEGVRCWPRSARMAWTSMARSSIAGVKYFHGDRPQRGGAEGVPKVAGRACREADFEQRHARDKDESPTAETPLIAKACGRRRSRRSWPGRRPRLVAQLAPGRRTRRSGGDSNDLGALGPSFSHEHDCATGWADPTNCLVIDIQII
jgi:hypothetical protein